MNHPLKSPPSPSISPGQRVTVWNFARVCGPVRAPQTPPCFYGEGDRCIASRPSVERKGLVTGFLVVRFDSAFYRFSVGEPSRFSGEWVGGAPPSGLRPGGQVRATATVRPGFSTRFEPLSTVRPG